MNAKPTFQPKIKPIKPALKPPMKIARPYRIGLYVTGWGVWLTGVLWVLYHYFMRVKGPFGFKTNPLEEWWLISHGAFAVLATWLFGTLYMGLALPLSAQADIGKVWNDLSDEPGTWGGHCTVSCGYSNLAGFGCAPVLDAVTWGTTQRMTPAWLAKYCDELYAPLTAKWIEANGDAPSGFDLAQLTADLALV